MTLPATAVAGRGSGSIPALIVDDGGKRRTAFAERWQSRLLFCERIAEL